MKTNAPRRRTAGGFTLVEMLTTMAIVAILIGLLVPAFGLIRSTAMMVRQKSQFSAIGVALEAFQTDFGDYPPSNYYMPGTTNPVVPGYCGAQKLAEAVVGWDGFGVHPRTEWRGDGLADWNKDGTHTAVDESLYHVTSTTPYETAVDNRSVRKGPYLELQSANAVKLSDIYPAGSWPTGLADTYVLVDQFGKVTNLRTRKKTGMPILYFKANRTGYLHQSPATVLPNAPLIFNVRNNRPLYYNTPPPFALNARHPLGHLGTDPEQDHFYNPTVNPNFATPPPRPYRSESYLLLSAGKDGLYGTPDDMWNFDAQQH